MRDDVSDDGGSAGCSPAEAARAGPVPGGAAAPMTAAPAPLPPTPAQAHIGWQASLAAFVVLVGAAAVIDVVTGINAIAATARIVWNGFVFAVLWSARSLEALVALIARRRAWRVTSFLTSVGFGYAGRVFLSAEHSREVLGWRDRIRAVVAQVRHRWLALSTAHKLLVAATLVIAQLAFLPAAAEYLVLFPVGFMIRPMVLGVRKLYSWIGDLIFGRVYWQYCGRAHNAVVRRCGRLVPVKAVSGASRLLRLQYLTAWRLWKYQPRYRDESGELWVSVAEPFRLWKNHKLDIYVGHPLLAGGHAGGRLAPAPAPVPALPAGPPRATSDVGA
jgi:hypothetical protein